VIYLAVRTLLWQKTASYAPFVVFTSLYAVLAYMLRGATACTFDETGELLSAGQDLSVGWWEYAFDILYVSAFIQLGSLYSSKFFWVALVVPIYLVYAARGMFNAYKALAPPTPEPAGAKKNPRDRRYVAGPR
jgi:hypothetical protein